MSWTLKYRGVRDTASNARQILSSSLVTYVPVLAIFIAADASVFALPVVCRQYQNWRFGLCNLSLMDHCLLAVIHYFAGACESTVWYQGANGPPSKIFTFYLLLFQFVGELEFTTNFQPYYWWFRVWLSSFLRVIPQLSKRVGWTRCENDECWFFVPCTPVPPIISLTSVFDPTMWDASEHDVLDILRRRMRWLGLVLLDFVFCLQKL